jgi:ribonuclease E
MPNKMLIDASHPEETRVVVVRGSRIEEFDFESQDKKQLKGNIYLARVTRVEPSLQAAFIEYGGNRHGFLAFSEIHPDYYQIPVADRQALLRAEAEDAEDEDDEEDEERGRGRGRRRRGRGRDRENGKRASGENGDAAVGSDGENEDETSDADETVEAADSSHDDDAREDDTGDESPDTEDGTDRGGPAMAQAASADVISEEVSPDHGGDAGDNGGGNGEIEEISSGVDSSDVESVGADDAVEEVRQRSRRFPRKQYKIQEVIKRRQILLVQVVKEERGNKGAALTTYLSLAGRYSVLMPNTARGGGISRKITNATDRKRLKDVVKDLDVPQGMGVILRTAGESRTKAEIKRDYEYLMRLWENVRTLTLQSTAPALVYEEGSLIKRSVRDLYNKDIDDIQVAGEEGYREAKDFMRMLMPSHAKVVQPYRDNVPLFVRHGVESQLDRMLQPQVTLKSGGYIIINQTEALVSIDVNSGRSTREHSIEDTALQTNLEAADEVARQLRLRDLAGLIVIDFIDMEENRNNRAVEKRMKDCLKNDRARIQVGRISHFGLLEMSRQRIRASVLESTMQPCPHCGGTGHVRSDSSVALLVLRAIEEFLLKENRYHLTVKTPMATALYVLNHKRRNLADLELKFGLSITIEGDETVGAQHYAIFKGALVDRSVIQPAAPQILPPALEPEDDDVIEAEVDEEADDEAETDEAPAQRSQPGQQRERGEDGEGGKRKRKRRRRRGGRDRDGSERPAGAPQGDMVSAETVDRADDDDDGEDEAAETTDAVVADGGNGEDRGGKRRRRGKRGGRRNRNGEAGGFAEAEGGEAVAADAAAEGEQVAETVEAVPDFVTEQAVTAEAVTADAEPAVAEEAAAEPAKPAKRTRRKAAVAEPVAEDTAEADAKPAKRTRRKAVAAEPQVDAVQAAPADERPIEVAAPAEPEVASERAAAEPESAPSAPKSPVVTSNAQPDAPRKGGWWQRKGFFSNN